MLIRRQPPAYSPVPRKVLPHLLRHVLHLGRDPRPDLRTLLQNEYNAREVLLCGSGTQALTIAIQAALTSVERGSSVALPAFSCFDVATAAVGADARVTFYDLDPGTLGPDLDSLERTLKVQARVVVAAPLYGMPIEWEPVRDLCSAYGAILIEDAAQGHGARWRRRPLGALGEISVLSFGRGKGWTGGAGGAVLVRESASVSSDRMRESGVSHEVLSALAVFAQWTLARPSVYGIPAAMPGLQLGQTVYRPPTPARAITRAAASALLATREESTREAEIRRANANQLLAWIRQNSKVRSIPPHGEASAGYLRLPIRLPRGMASIDSASRALTLGVAASYPTRLPELGSIVKRRVGTEAKWPGADALVRELITLPTHSRVRLSERNEIMALIPDSFRG